MPLTVLRRLRRHAVIETVPAPLFSREHIDITDDIDDDWYLRTRPPLELDREESRAVNRLIDVETVAEARDFTPDTMLLGPTTVDRRALADRGTCYHHEHVDVHGRGRMGLLIDGHRASLLPCLYANSEGR